LVYILQEKHRGKQDERGKMPDIHLEIAEKKINFNLLECIVENDFENLSLGSNHNFYVPEKISKYPESLASN
jgi:hypothetical protein